MAGHVLEVKPLTDTIGAEVFGLNPDAISLYDRSVLRSAWHKHHVLVEDKDVMQARLALAKAARIVIANGLGVLGISAPERM